MRARTLATLVAVATLLRTPGTASADSEPRDLRDPLTVKTAIEKEQEAKRLLEVGEIDAAVETCKAGYVLEPTPRWLFNIAVIYNTNGRSGEAIEWLDRLESKPWKLNDSSLAAIKTLRADAEAKANAERSAATVPQPQNQREPERQVPIVPRRADSGEPFRERWHHDRLGWIVVGSGAVVAAAGAALVINASQLRRDADDALDANERVRLRDSADTRQAIGFVAMGVGAAALVAGTIKLALVPSDERVGVALAPSPSGLSFTVHARW